MADVTRARIGAATHLVAPGPLTEAGEIRLLSDAVAACLASHEHQLVLDFTRVGVVNSQALEFLRSTQEQLEHAGGSLKVIHVNAVVRDVFRMTALFGRMDARDGGGAAPGTPRRHGGGTGALRIGEILRERGLVDDETLEKGLAVQQQTGGRLAEIMVAQGWLPEADLLEALGDQLSLPFVRLRTGLYDPEVARRIGRGVAERLNVLPLFELRGVIYLATADPQSIPAMETVQDLTGLVCEPVLACSEEIRSTIEEAHGEGHNLAEFVGNLESDLEVVETEVILDGAAIDEMAAGNPIVNLINGVIQRAIRDRASDIHIEPSRNRCRIRLRVDGVLYPFMSPPSEVHPALVSRLKVMARLDIAERRLPQDGRIQVVTQGRAVDLRFSSLPGIFGEKVVLRVLDKNESILDVHKLGLRPANLEVFEALLARSYGLVLVTGPTGSGKTTTLYAAINHLDSDEKNIVTIEDPVEYQIDTINQNQVKESIQLGFAKMLKHVLRQDPDVIMVGEIRERETAQIAVQAALTGHLVLSTLHTNDSVGAVTRMLDMGVEPFLLSSALIGVMAQRLVRTVCPECRTTYVAPASVLEPHGVEAKGKLRLSRGRGCASCYDSGYKGRIAIHEILQSEPGLQRLIVRNPSRDALDEYVKERKLATLLTDGVERVRDGDTTLEEILRVVNS